MTILKYLIKTVISVAYGILVSFLVTKIFGMEWGSAFALTGFCMIVIGALLAQSQGSYLPQPQMNQNNSNSMDSAGLRNTSQVGTLVNEAERGLRSGGGSKTVTGQGSKLVDYLFKRSAIEVILAGIVMIGFTAIYYMEYFI